jgi:Protein of unknown function (DUF1616)
VRGHGDLRAAALAAPLCAIVALLSPWEALAAAFAVPLALALPGYAIVAAAFARRELEGAQIALLSLALSLATLALGALVLDYAPGGIRDISWAVLLVAVVLACCRTAALRRRAPTPTPLPRLRLGIPQLAMGLGALAATVAALVLSATTLPAKDALGFTQLWIVPAPGTGRTEAGVGVASEEQEATDFDLRVRVGDDQIIRRSFRLRPGEDRVVRVGPAAGRRRAPVPVVATLLRHNRPFSVYRRVRGWLAASGERP